MKKLFLMQSLVNENMDIVYSSGNNPLLIRPEGLPTNNIYQNLHSALSIDLRAAIHLVESGQAKAYTEFQRIFLQNQNHWARLILVNVPYQSGIGRLTLIFCQIEEVLNLPIVSMDADLDLSLNTFAKEQERQLLKAKEQLQTVIEELETSNEEMQSMNEELQSSNEELQSSNEELETTNEELQSTNEELQTAYAELRMAYDEKEEQQRKLNEVSEELKLAKTLLEDAEKMGRNGSMLWNLEQRTMVWSKGTYKVFELDEELFTPSYEAFIGLAHPDDRAKLENHLTNLVTGKSANKFEYRGIVTKDKKAIWVSLDAVVSFGAHKQAEKVIGTITDITEQVLSDYALSRKQKKIDLLMNKSTTGVYIYDLLTDNLSYINEDYTRILGYNKDVITSMSSEQFMGLFHPDDVSRIEQHIGEVCKATEYDDFFSIEYRMRHNKTQEHLRLHSNNMVYDFDEQGNPVSIIGSFTEL